MSRYAPLVLAALVAASSAPARAEPPKPIDRKLEDEDKDVAALIKEKGWDFRKGYSHPTDASAKVVELTISNKDEPAARVKLSADEWKTLAKSKTVQHLRLVHVDTDDAALQSIAAMEPLETLLLNSKLVTDAGLKHLAKHPRLWALTIFSADNVTDVGLAALAASPGLRILHIGGGTFTGTGLAAFADANSLDQLRVANNSVTDEGAKAVAKLTGLRDLSITSAKVTAAGIRAIVDKHVPQYFHFNPRLIDDDLLALLVTKGWLYRSAEEQVGWVRPLPVDAEGVTSVALLATSITDAGLKAFANCPNLATLYLSETRITDAGLVAVAEAHPKLRTLLFAETKVTGAGVRAIAELDSLIEIDASGCALDEAAFRALGSVKKLEELNLTGVKAKPEWLKHIGGAKLRRLNVGDTTFNDAAATALATAAPNLEWLTVDKTALGDTGLKALAGLSKLRTLYNYGTPATKAGVAAFKKALPKCYVSFDGKD